ncbi:MICAL-like protein 1 isoform X1 [Anopheles merus]|uniref:MICAL-like protein 1 isoform X1 n=3 Tax=Anopheles merus TaxID=30066 RepID=UPI001BE43363|nr:MICAL-like protein 1 isoform X1 [Anopheles merus]XP_041766280.1 MICAL-like protein 1 isoform X1 [Anopheles merus]XP_041766281.1 MICAL-like protein 1 isoform X1 [Anopheles merus]
MSERRGTKALELWCRRIAEGYKDVKITNMSTSWRDGLAFCAIIHNFRPDLIDFASLSKDNVYYNNELAFTIAEQHLGIPSLLDPADMVKYEVPDRFSILTYLSQYYRVFSNQEPASKKVVAKDTKTDDLTSKMANKAAFVGVPKRASCNRCSNPIFLAERISFGEKSYHRSCLKCARCGTQLTVGSFYETETDGEYCCETCPDEEIQLEQRRESSASPDGSSANVTGDGTPVAAAAASIGLPKNVRSSKLLDRISFFESAPLSDEEKSSNLERKARMSHFLKESLKTVEQDNDEPPDLPLTGPPSSVTNDSLNGKEEEDTDDSDSDNVDDVEDEFEKLVQDLDEPDLDISKPPLADPKSPPRADAIASESETTAQTDTIKPNEQEQQKVAEVVLQTEVVVEESVLETNSLEVQDKSEIATPVKVEDDSELTNNLPVEATVEAKEINPLAPPVTEQTTTMTESSDLTSEHTIKDVVEDKRTETKEQPSTEISNDDTPAAEVGVIVENGSVASVPVSESTTEHLDVPNENESTESLATPSEESKNATESTERSNSMVPNETVESAVSESKVPVSVNEEESTIPTDTPEACNKVDNDEGLPAVSTQEDGNEQEQYPSDLNPFGDEDDGEGREQIVELRKVPAGGKPVPTLRRVSTNPFGSEDEDEDVQQSPSSKPPRPPPPKVLQSPSSGGSSSKPVPANPFDEDDDDEPTDEPEIVPVSKPSPRRTPVPTPRKAHAYNDSISSLDNSLMSSSRLSSSNVSLTSSLESGPSSLIVPKRKKGKAPDIPLAVSGASTPIVSQQQQQMGVSSAVRTSVENLSNSSGSGTLTTPRKKRLAPAPPPVPNSSSTPKQSSTLQVREEGGLTRVPSQRLLSVDASLLSNNDRDMSETMSRGTSNESVVYRRTIVPLVLDDDGPESPVHLDGTTNTSGRQWEKMKDNKEAQNRNRQSQSSPTSEATSNSFGSPGGNLSILSNKSSQGKWKRRKGPAPALPMMAAPLPERKPIKMLPLKEIHQELQIIETQQQGLEKQGIVLETMIRERCEGVEADVDLDIRLQPNSKEVEDLLMQLFELVNEKNELFRRQAELMYLRRMHRLEQEQADLEYEIRLLMAQPERNKTDSDKEKEEALITRLVEIVQLRNEVVECLEMDRIREAEEDLSIKQSIEERAASQQSKHSKKDSSASSTTLPLTDAEKRDSSTKLSKKEKKKLKEAKKLVKSKKIDSEKDADETESNTTKEKKKKRKFLF